MRKTPFKKVLLYWIGLMGWSILLFTQFSTNKKKKHIKVKIILLLFYSAQIQLLSLVCQHTESDQKNNSSFVGYCCLFVIFKSDQNLVSCLTCQEISILSWNFVENTTFYKDENSTLSQAFLVSNLKKLSKLKILMNNEQPINKKREEFKTVNYFLFKEILCEI